MIDRGKGEVGESPVRRTWMIRIQCDCGKWLKLGSSMLGKPAACPGCGNKVRVVSAGAGHSDNEAGHYLRVRSGPQQKGECIYPVGERAITIGKSAESQLRLRSDSVSRRHCRLVMGAAGWRVEDLGSTNGLFVNGCSVREHDLCDGDTIRIGEYELLYRMGERQRGGDVAEGLDVVGRSGNGELTLLDDLPDSGNTVSCVPPVPVEHVEGGGVNLASDEQVCPACGKSRPADARVCVTCGIDLLTGQPIAVAPMDFEGAKGATKKAPGTGWVFFLRDCLASFVFFTDFDSLSSFIVVAIIAVIEPFLFVTPSFSIMGYLLIPCGLVIVYGWIFSYYFNTALYAASGEKKNPELSFTDGWFDGVIIPFLKFSLAGLMVICPAIFYGMFWIATTAGPGVVRLGSPDWIFFTLLGLGLFLWPMVLLLVAMGGFSCFSRPDLIVSTIIKTFVPYVVTFLMAGLALMTKYKACFLIGALPGLGNHPLLLSMVVSVVSVYFGIVAMRVIGLYYHHFKDRFAWSWG